MSQISHLEEACHLIRGSGHRRPLFQDRGPLGTGPSMTVFMGRVRVRVLFLLRVYECEFLRRPASMNKPALRLR